MSPCNKPTEQQKRQILPQELIVWLQNVVLLAHLFCLRIVKKFKLFCDKFHAHNCWRLCSIDPSFASVLRRLCCSIRSPAEQHNIRVAFLTLLHYREATDSSADSSPAVLRRRRTSSPDCRASVRPAGSIHLHISSSTRTYLLLGSHSCTSSPGSLGGFYCSVACV